MNALNYTPVRATTGRATLRTTEDNMVNFAWICNKPVVALPSIGGSALLPNDNKQRKKESVRINARPHYLSIVVDECMNQTTEKLEMS